VKILGIWDGHDAGAALIVDGRLVTAVNEERFTRRKLDIGFPRRAVAACCEIGAIKPADVEAVACSTSDPAKTLGRILPSTREAYYQLRRRKAKPGPFTKLRKRAKYWITEWPPNGLSRSLSRRAIRRDLASADLGHAELRLYDHHACHAVAAAQASGFDRCLVITVDGVGDGLASTVSTFVNGRLERIGETPARHSPGVFFEHVTNLLNMRELEDEGKVMALADYASPVADSANPLMDLIDVSDLRFVTAAPGHALHSRLRDVLWYYPNEQFAFMAQRALERACVRLAENAVLKTGCGHVALSGGVASNVKANRRIRQLPGVERLFVYPHMGDGGLAVGAALMAAQEKGVVAQISCENLGWGPAYSAPAVRAVLEARGACYVESADIAAQVAELLCRDQVVMWFQGGMEYGPRALGHRSVLARPDRPALRDRLNLVLKRRVWYQPFCPSMLDSDAARLLSDWNGEPNRHMTMAFMVAGEHQAALAGVMNVDGSCRPQMVADAAPGPYAALLREMRARTGFGAVLNTSFNIHGEPLVCDPGQALDVFYQSGADALAVGPYLVTREIQGL
jgi:carbamoyltransferase